jgi:alcohol dehydrogenase class IV
MDVAKVVAFLGQRDCRQNIQDIYGVGMCNGSRMPLIQVPTTAGTGSEVTPISIVTTGESEKKGIVSPVLLPDWAVLDGELTTSLPSKVTAATGIDAMVHAIEAYTSKIKKNPLSDLLAKEALRLLGSNIRRVCSEGGAADAEARGQMLLGSLYAGMAFANAPVAAVHALAYPIGALFHVPHGVSNVLMLS